MAVRTIPREAIAVADAEACCWIAPMKVSWIDGRILVAEIARTNSAIVRICTISGSRGRLLIQLKPRELPAWPDEVGGVYRLKPCYMIAPLSNGHVALLVSMSKSLGLPCDMIFPGILILIGFAAFLAVMYYIGS